MSCSRCNNKLYTQSSAAEPLLGPSGEVLDGGADISFAAIASYYQDIIYLCSFVQVLCIFTDIAFWFFWLLPLFAAWIVYTTFIKPVMAQRAAFKVISLQSFEVEVGIHSQCPIPPCRRLSSACLPCCLLEDRLLFHKEAPLSS